MRGVKYPLIMYLVVEENPNCAADERMFSDSGEKRHVEKIEIETPSGTSEWCDVIGVDEDGVFTAAQAARIEDSSDGSAWLVFGGNWGLRFQRTQPASPWSMADSSQWGRPFVVLDSSGNSIRFAATQS